MRHPRCCRGLPRRGRAWPALGGWEAACGPRGAGLPRRDLPGQRLGLLKMISSPLANELAAGRAPPASPHPAALPLPPRSGGEASPFAPPDCSHGQKDGGRQGRRTPHGRRRDFGCGIPGPNAPHLQTALTRPREEPQQPNPPIRVCGHNVNGPEAASAVPVGPT